MSKKGRGEQHVLSVPLRGIIQCHLHPAIPWQVAPQQSLPPFHRVSVRKRRNDLRLLSGGAVAASIGP